MLARVRAMLSFANVVSVAALCVALGGIAYAVTRLEANSVKSRHIAPSVGPPGNDVTQASSWDFSALQPS